MGLGGVAIAVPPYVIHPKTAVLGRAGGGKSTDNHNVIVLVSLMWLYTTPQSYDFFLKLARISGESFEKSYFWMRPSRHVRAPC